MMNPAIHRMTSGVNFEPPPSSNIGATMNRTPPTNPSNCRHSAMRDRSW